MNGNGTGRTRGFGRWTVVAVLAVTAAASGCKMGTAGTRPSWWTFGGTPKDDADKLAAAPSFSGDVTKPSASAKPYPTTGTPNGYVIDGATKPGAAAVAATAPTAVTYGVTPPPATPDPVEMATAPARSDTAAGTVPPLTSIAPQVGPYASLPADPSTAPGVAEPPPLQAIAGGAVPAAAPTMGASSSLAPPAAPQRVADARGSAGWPGQPAGVSAGSRYDTGSSSRFGGGSAIDQPLPPPAAASMLPAALEPLPPAAAPAAAVPSAGFPAPPVAAPPASPPAVPASPAAPLRRADPAYRPGGTSSYRHSSAILAADPPPTTPGAVRPVGFDAPAADLP